MTTDELDRVKHLCSVLHKIITKIENAETMHEVSNLCVWAVGDLMALQRLAAHRMLIMHTDLQRKANK